MRPPWWLCRWGDLPRDEEAGRSDLFLLQPAWWEGIRPGEGRRWRAEVEVGTGGGLSGALAVACGCACACGCASKRKRIVGAVGAGTVGGLGGAPAGVGARGGNDHAGGGAHRVVGAGEADKHCFPLLSKIFLQCRSQHCSLQENLAILANKNFRKLAVLVFISGGNRQR